MKELNDLIEYCHQQYTAGNCIQCQCNGFCGSSAFQCESCLYHIQHASQPQFHYSCKRITYYYTLKFFDRFASEIKRFFFKPKEFDRKEYYFVSLGCGPGSELYGIVDGLRSRMGNDFSLKYRGYDQNQIWYDIQSKSKNLFTGTNCDVDFYACDMFNQWQDSIDCQVFALVLNYLLSDSQKYMKETQLKIFLDSIVDFIMCHKVKFLVFNDINYFGYTNLDSGVKCMDYIIEQIKLKVKSVTGYKLLYKSDGYKPVHWREWEDDSLLMGTDYNKTKIAKPWTHCLSKYIIARINY